MTKTVIKRIAGILATSASAQAILFWIGTSGKLIHLALFLALACFGALCFHDKEEER